MIIVYLFTAIVLYVLLNTSRKNAARWRAETPWMYYVLLGEQILMGVVVGQTFLRTMLGIGWFQELVYKLPFQDGKWGLYHWMYLTVCFVIPFATVGIWAWFHPRLATKPIFNKLFTMNNFHICTAVIVIVMFIPLGTHLVAIGVDVTQPLGHGFTKLARATTEVGFDTVAELSLQTKEALLSNEIHVPESVQRNMDNRQLDRDKQKTTGTADATQTIKPPVNPAHN